MIDHFQSQVAADLVEKFGEERVVLEIAELRLDEVKEELRALRYLHSESRKNAVFAKLHSPKTRQAFALLHLDFDAFESEVRRIVGHLGTTRPNGVKRAPGGGRPPSGNVRPLPLFS